LLKLARAGKKLPASSGGHPSLRGRLKAFFSLDKFPSFDMIMTHSKEKRRSRIYRESPQIGSFASAMRFHETSAENEIKDLKKEKILVF